MARSAPDELVFFRYEGDDRKDVFWRIKPTAVRYNQSVKGSASETLGGRYTETLYAVDDQLNGRLMADLTLEGTTGIRYRRELDDIKWIWEHQAILKADGKLPDIYFYDLISDRPYQNIERNKERIYLIFIQSFGFDDSANNFGEVRFSFRCKILRDILAPLEQEISTETLPTIDVTNATISFTPLPATLLPTRN